MNSGYTKEKMSQYAKYPRARKRKRYLKSIGISFRTLKKKELAKLDGKQHDAYRFSKDNPNPNWSS